ncbi:beta-galactosidase [Paenibacillus sinopodophylli]|uniref:beta-galactosidase n=1 Tax=Paenibacillus sinopodophylli TaxID=1837342 RepID=UPI00110C9BFD|nr:beta-galactosidase [Paenibacillus sinopodophylli]
MSEAGFIPFGFQYYRSPTPYRDQWEEDLRNLSQMGFNCVKFWVQWRASHPAENAFVFDDIRELMDIAGRNGLKVVLNTLFDVAPAWFYKKYPDSKMITSDGTVIEPRALSYRQIGGAPGPCYHHAPGQLEKDKFLAEAVKAFRDHPALWVWDLWNEPELTAGIKRELSFDNQVCYCEHSLQAFGGWLEHKYGTLEALNYKWQRTYQNWDEIEPPRGQAVFNDMVDWRLFMSDALTDDLKCRIAVVKQLDTVHPVMVHTVPSPIFNLITAGSDDFKLAEPCDLFGNSLGSSAWSADLLISAAKGKPIINSEIHALPGNTALKPQKLSWQELKKHILIPLARGISGFLFWQYRPEVLGHEAPAWGSTYLDGSETPWLREMASLNETIQANRNPLLCSKRPSDGIAILFSSENQIANFSVYAHLDTYTDSVQGAHKLLHDLNYKVEFIHDHDISKEELAKYKCLWMPYPLYLNKQMTDVIREWVSEGGIVLSECSFGALQAEDGTHSYQVPGYGFDEVFGIRETWIHSIENLDHSYHNVTVQSKQKIPLNSALGYDPAQGSYYKTEIELLRDVRVAATFSEDSSAAVTVADYGKGRAVWIGTLLGASYWQEEDRSTLEFLGKIMEEELGLEPYVKVHGGQARADVLEWKHDGEEGAFLFVHNTTNRDTDFTVSLPFAYDGVTPWFPEGANTLVENDVNDSIQLSLKAGDIQVFQLHEPFIR